jgi:hypothetical protein
MATYAFNGYNTWNNASYVLSPTSVYCSVLIPNGRITSAGTYPVIVTGLHPFWGGRNSTNASMSLGPYSTALFGLPVGSSGTQIGVGISAPFNGQQYVTFAMGWATGGINFGRQSGVGGISVVVSSTGSTWATSTIGGYFDYVYAPAPPSTPVLTQSGGGNMTATFSASGDNGGTGYTGYVLQYATNPSMSGATTIASSGTSNLTLSPGSQYWFRAASRNGVTDYYGVYSAWSGISTITLQSGGKRFDAATSAFVAANAHYYNLATGQWVNSNNVKRYDAASAAWVTAN